MILKNGARNGMVPFYGVVCPTTNSGVSQGEGKDREKGKGREIEGEWQKALIWFSLTFEDERRIILNAGDEIEKKLFY